MPPIAEEMAGAGGTGPTGQPQQQQQEEHHPQQQHTKKKGHRPRITSVRSDLLKGDKLPGQHLGVVKGRDEGETSRSSPSTSMLEDSGTAEASISMLAMRAVVPKDNVPDAGLMSRYSSDPNIGAEFFKKEPCIYSHRMFERAAKIFLGLKEAREAKLEKRKIGGPAKCVGGAGAEAGAGGRGRGSVDEGKPGGTENTDGMDFRNIKEQKLTYELAFSSLKFETVFEDMLEDVAFFSVYPDLRDIVCLVMVVLWDYQSRKFQPRIQFDVDELVEDVSCIERAIMAQKVKLAACLARRRIKESAPSIDYLLPEKFRGKGTASKPLPVHAWVNTAKISPAELLFKLKGEKFTQLWMPPVSAKEFPTKSFYLDPHCSDVLVFSTDCNALLQEHPLVDEGYLVKQDKSSCLAAESVVHLLGDEQDVLMVNPGSGITAAHVAVLLKPRKGGVVVVTDAGIDDYFRMMRSFEFFGVTKQVKVIQQNFMDMDPDDCRLKSVRAALVIAECTKSAITNIVNFIVTEGENLKMLQEASEQSDDLDDHIIHMQTTHITVLREALKLPRLHGVTYLTRSVYSQENEVVVQRAVEYVNVVQVHHQLRPWRVIPPVVTFSSDEVDDQVGIQGKTAFFKPCDLNNGCFVVCIAREPDDTQTVRAKAMKAVSKTKVGGSSSMSSSASRTKKSAHRKKPEVSGGGGGGGSGGSSPNGSPTSSRSSRHKVPEHVKVVKHPAPFR